MTGKYADAVKASIAVHGPQAATTIREAEKKAAVVGATDSAVEGS